MPFFKYEGIDKTGKKVKGRLEASGKNAVVSRLMSEGILVSDVKEAGDDSGGLKNLNISFGKKSVADIFFQLSILLSSGIQLTKALTVTAQTVKDRKMKDALLDICERVSEGKRFSDALENYKKIFNELYVHMIRTSEKVGRLSYVLMNISRFEEEKRKAGDKLTGAMIYPTVVLTFGLGVVGFMLAFVVPKLQNIFASAGADIPTSTKILLMASWFLQHFGLFIFLGILVGASVFSRYYVKKGKFRLELDKKLYKLAFVQDVTAARVSNVLSFQLREGLPLVEALRNTAGGVANVHVRDALMDVAESVAAGRKFSESISQTGLFTELFVAAAATGEKSGNLPDLMDRVNVYYSRKTEQFTARFVSVIEPVFIMFIGLVVGFIVVSIMEPLFSIDSLVK